MTVGEYGNSTRSEPEHPKEEVKSEQDRSIDGDVLMFSQPNVMPEQRMVTSHQYYTFKTVKPKVPRKKKTKKREEIVT